MHKGCFMDRLILYVIHSVLYYSFHRWITWHQKKFLFGKEGLDCLHFRNEVPPENGVRFFEEFPDIFDFQLWNNFGNYIPSLFSALRSCIGCNNQQVSIRRVFGDRNGKLHIQSKTQPYSRYFSCAGKIVGNCCNHASLLFSASREAYSKAFTRLSWSA